MGGLKRLERTDAAQGRSSDKTHPFFRWVRERSALAFGVVESSTSRDEAWQFFVLGRSIERADMTARLLATRTLTEAGGPDLDDDAAQLRRIRGVPAQLPRRADGRNAAEFLLLDRLFPRSVLFGILQAEECLRGIDPNTARTVVVATRGVRMLGQMRSELEYRPIADILDDLPESMDAVQVAMSVASEAIRQRYFPSIAMPGLGRGAL